MLTRGWRVASTHGSALLNGAPDSTYVATGGNGGSAGGRIRWTNGSPGYAVVLDPATSRVTATTNVHSGRPSRIAGRGWCMSLPGGQYLGITVGSVLPEPVTSLRGASSVKRGNDDQFLSLSARLGVWPFRHVRVADRATDRQKSGDRRSRAVVRCSLPCDSGIHHDTVGDPPWATTSRIQRRTNVLKENWQ
jgi:hypothetical protein